MRFIELLLCAVLLSFLAGIVYEIEYTDTVVETGDRQINVSNVTNRGNFNTPTSYNIDDPNLVMPNQIKEDTKTELKPCSKVNTMPCETSPRNPLREKLDAKESRPGLFKEGEAVTCIYPAIYWWTDGNQFVKNVAMKCTVVQASEPWDDIEKDYQHVQVDCSKDIDFQSSSQPGVGMVKGHKLMYKVRWFSSTDCYHFQQR